ncbi:MAG: site-specific DNA-methyltransferase [Nanoarchaeota archaeon]
MEVNKIYNGDALSILKTFPDNFIDCVVTSPPYYLCRDYGNKNIIVWDENKNCQHDFKVKERYVHRGSANNTVQGAILNKNLEVDWKTKDGFCLKCNAWEGQLGLEPNLELFIKHLCDIFDEVKRVLKKDGTCFVVIGDTYSGNMGKRNGWTDNKLGFTKQGAIDRGVCLTNKTKTKYSIPSKSLMLIPFRFAIEMQKRGWIVRNVIIWKKPSCMPSSAKDRFTIDFEYVFFFVKNKKYFFNQIKEPSKYKDRGKRAKYGYNGKKIEDGYRNELPKRNAEEFAKKNCPDFRNKRCVWEVNPKGTKKESNEDHFAVFPEKLIEDMILAGCPRKGIILDPFFGLGTTGLVSLKQGKNFVGIEINQNYISLAEKRLKPFLEQQKL